MCPRSLVEGDTCSSPATGTGVPRSTVTRAAPPARQVSQPRAAEVVTLIYYQDPTGQYPTWRLPPLVAVRLPLERFRAHFAHPLPFAGVRRWPSTAQALAAHADERADVFLQGGGRGFKSLNAHYCSSWSASHRQASSPTE